MKKEDIEFLRELQHELNTQEHDAQAEPRFWGIIEYEEYPSNSDSYDNEYIYSCQDAEQWTHKEAVEWIDDVVHESFPEFQEEWNTEVKDNFEAEDLCEWANENLGMDLEMFYTCDYEKLSDQTGCFLTKRAAKLHLEKNGYHYNNGKTYAMTAWRNPEFERVLNILQTMNIDDIKLTED